ncbi:O-antigen ligase family protein [Aeromonas media]|uniref:O-antigen ligase family protein n=1 Tax=Aeromonas media TaxID=651 RepID=UPI0013A6B4F3|nr:O-antigen ligase family protein [Aeromonas media]
MADNRFFWLCLYLMSVPCGMYIYGFFPAPYYVFFIASIMLSFIILPNKIMVTPVISFLVTLSVFAILFTDSKINVWSYYLIGVFAFYYAIIFGSSVSDAKLKIIIHHVILVAVVICALDTIYRFSFPKKEYIDAILEQGNDNLMFYAYKHSFIFQDSNFIGLYLLSATFLLINNRSGLSNKKYYVFLILLVVLVLLTFSRAAIVGLVFGLIAHTYLRIKVKYIIYARSLLLLILILTMLVLLFFTIGLSSNVDINAIYDGSFITKLTIVDNFITTMENKDIYGVLFGWGLDNTSAYWGIAAHNLFFTLILETGIVGFVIILMPFLFYSVKYKEVAPQAIALSIACFSFGLIFSPVTIPFALNILSVRNK